MWPEAAPCRRRINMKKYDKDKLIVLNDVKEAIKEVL